jgi:hypothetical protein
MPHPLSALFTNTPAICLYRPERPRDEGMLAQHDPRNFNQKAQISRIFASVRCKNHRHRHHDAKTRHFCNIPAYKSKNF